MPSTSTSLQIVNETKLDPAWDKARDFLTQGRKAAAGLASEIERLRARYLRDGHANLKRGNSPASHDETPGDEDGFKAQVEAQLGLSSATAYRYLSLAKAVAICDQVERAPKGETIELEAGSYEITDEVRQKAKHLRESIINGDTPINRALPAVAGMFSVAGGGTGGKAATHHGKNIWAGIQKLTTSLLTKHWRRGEFTPKRDWDDAVSWWVVVLDHLPEELKQTTADWVKRQTSTRK